MATKKQPDLGKQFAKKAEALHSMPEAEALAYIDVMAGKTDYKGQARIAYVAACRAFLNSGAETVRVAALTRLALPHDAQRKVFDTPDYLKEHRTTPVPDSFIGLSEDEIKKDRLYLRGADIEYLVGNPHLEDTFHRTIMAYMAIGQLHRDVGLSYIQNPQLPQSTHDGMVAMIGEYVKNVHREMWSNNRLDFHALINAYAVRNDLSEASQSALLSVKYKDINLALAGNENLSAKTYRELATRGDEVLDAMQSNPAARRALASTKKARTELFRAMGVELPPPQGDDPNPS